MSHYYRHRGQFVLPSPDGDKVIFDYGGTRLERDIFLLDRAQGEITQLTSAAAYDIPGDWSPTSDQIAFISDRDDGFYRLFIMNSDGTNQHIIPLINDSEQNVHSVKWSPNGNQILYTAGKDTYANPGLDLFVVNLATLGVQRISSPDWGICEEGNWSPDGKQIVATCEAGIYLALSDGTEAKHLSKMKDLKDCHSPEWDPNGQWIALVCKDLDNKVGIYIVRFDDSELRYLTNRVPEDLTNFKEPIWLRNGQQLIYLAESSNIGLILLSDLDGNYKELIQERAVLRFLSVIYSN